MDINSYVSNFINLPTQIIVLISSFLYLKRIKLTVKEFLAFVIFIFIPAIIFYISVYWVGIIYLIVSFVVFFILLTKEKFTVFYLGFLFIIAIMIDHLSTLLISSIFITDYLTQIFCRILIFVALFSLAVYVIRLIMDAYLTKINISSNNKWLISIVILLSLVVFYVNIFRVFKDTNIEAVRTNMFIFMFYLFLILILLCFIVYIFTKEEKLKAREKEYENFSIYINSLEQVNKDMQNFRHDYSNILLSMRGYIVEKDWVGLEKYFEKGILKFERKTIVNNIIIDNIKNLHIKGLKGLLYSKSNKAVEKDINISIEIPNPIFHISVDIIDLNRILGILLDNAIENSIEDKMKDIYIAILHKENQSTLFTIRNQIKDKEIAINKIYEEGYTTKENGQGIGLAMVKQIVDKNPQLVLNTWLEHNWFCLELLILEGRKDEGSNM
ncbi:GHKL domain-containing protein [Lysinibacillus sphaericus]|uniref:sensor histidine kinase n=3 Tax=Lysinibacillus sphaericus TaxID=1421 RepID=UPI001E5072D0|nr:GHKL domain-containing protein [Lysinibacillus sphaericus]UDK98234.1 GHKL domain-containing protein [Lysinibacillus sphaericus]